jgi:hypothetical protein
MLIGYAGVSTRDQNPDGQLDALAAAGVEPRHTYVDMASGTLGAAAAVRRGPQASTDGQLGEAPVHDRSRPAHSSSDPSSAGCSIGSPAPKPGESKWNSVRSIAKS